VNKKNIDYTLLIITLVLVGIGIVMVFSASYYTTEQRWGDSYFFLRRQLMWAAIGFIVLIGLSNLDYALLRKFSIPLVLLSIGLLVIVLIIGEERNFARRWLDFAGVSVQPSEIARFAMILFLADSISRRKDGLKFFFKSVVPYLLLLGVFFILILMQPNFSMAGSLAILVMVMLFVGGIRLWHLILLGVSSAAGGWLLLKSADYRVERLTAFLDPFSDPLDTGFQLIQSLYALGSGGVSGVGIGQSMQKHLFIPHPETDFIFAIFGEEFGFLGATVLIIIFFCLIGRGISIAMAAPDLFGCLLATGITSMLAIQVIINIAVVTGSMPPTGLPLPFISFGGSSLLIFMGSVGVLLNISKHTSLPKQIVRVK